MHSLEALVEATPRLTRPVVVAVDGVDGSGKTTFAARLAQGYRGVGRDVVVVHLDDFLNPRTLRYRRGRDSPLGYFLDSYDLESFEDAVLRPLARDETPVIALRAFDHRSDEPRDDEPVSVPPRAVVIVEGMFLHRDELAGRWDVSAFLDVPFCVSVARMAARDGTHPDPSHPSLKRYVDGQRLTSPRAGPNDAPPS